MVVGLLVGVGKGKLGTGMGMELLMEWGLGMVGLVFEEGGRFGWVEVRLRRV